MGDGVLHSRAWGDSGAILLRIERWAQVFRPARFRRRRGRFIRRIRVPKVTARVILMRAFAGDDQWKSCIATILCEHHFSTLSVGLLERTETYSREC